jgi:soluble lytic murein transglycosylase
VLNPAFPVRPSAQPAGASGRTYSPQDLAPYFAQGKLAEAKLEFVKGYFEKARLLLEAEGNSVPVRYLRALSALRGDDYRRAAAEFSALADEYSTLRSRCLTHAGVAYEELGEFDAAAALFAKVDKTSTLYPDARLGLARVLRRKGDLPQAIEAVMPIAKMSATWGRDFGAEGLIALADLWHSLRKADAERDALIQLWSLHPLSPLAEQADRRLKGARLPLQAQIDHAEHLVEAHRNKLGMTLLKPLLAKRSLPDPLACRAHFIYAKALRKERQHTQAILQLAPLALKCNDPSLRPRVLYALGGSRSIVDVERAAGTYETLAKEFPDNPLADDALFYAADLYLKKGDWRTALDRLDELRRRFPTGDFRMEALFKSFWIHWRQNHLEQAAPLLDEIEEVSKDGSDSYELERAAYWRGRLLAEQSEEKKAVEIWARVATEHPGGYYGLLSRARLESLEPDRARRTLTAMGGDRRTDTWALPSGPLGDDPHFLTGIELLRLGFPDAATSELLSVDRPRLPLDSLRLLVRALAATGDLRAAHAVARLSLRKDFSGPVTPENRSEWEIAYPNAFRNLIEKHCREASLDADLLQALMREESALDPKALSGAGALGLTQLMLPTAREVGRRLKIQKVTAETLLEPDQNIHLGASYLAMLLKQFSGNKAYAVAAYNAGALPVKRWRDSNPQAELDEWVEEIPIDQTRAYVKRVLRSYNVYRLLYSSDGPITAVNLSGGP